MTSDIHPERSTIEELCIMQGDPEGAEAEGARRATRILVAILGVFLAAAVVIANAAEGDKEEALITRKGNDYVRLTAPPCASLPSWRSGDALLEGKRYKLCWKSMLEPQPHVRVVFEDGDVWTLPHRAFQPESQNPAGI